MTEAQRRTIIASGLAHAGQQLAWEFASEAADSAQQYEMSELIGTRIVGIIWYGHEGAKYFACTCGERHGDLSAVDWAVVREHYMTCQGQAAPTGAQIEGVQ